MLKPGDIVRINPKENWSRGMIHKYGYGPHRVVGPGNCYGVFLETTNGVAITWETGSGPNNEVNFHETDLEFDRFMTAVAKRKRRKESYAKAR